MRWSLLPLVCLYQGILPAQWQQLAGGLYPGGARSMVYNEQEAKLHVFGQFDFANDTIDADGTALWSNGGWSAMEEGIDGFGSVWPPLGACFYDDGICVGGFFPGMSGVPGTAGLAYWKNEQWQHIGNVDPGVPIGLTVLDGELNVLGIFDSIDGVYCNNWGIYDGVNWRRGDTSTVIDNRPACLVRYQGDLYLGGNFSLPDGTHDVARKGPIGWETLGPGLGCDPWVNDLVEYHGMLYVGGEFCPIGPGAPYLMAWNGTQWINPFPQIEFTAQVRDMHLMDDRLVITGRFRFVGQQQQYGLLYYDGDELCVIGGEDLALINIGGGGDSLFVSTLTGTLTGHPNADSVNFIAKWDMNNLPDTCLTVGPVAVPEYSEQHSALCIAPNPGTDRITVFGGGGEITLLDACGRSCLSDLSTGEGTLVDTGQLPSGPYIVQLVTNVGTVLRVRWVKE